MVAFFVLQCITAPFMDPAGNASEFISRVNYVATAALSLAVVLNVPGQAILEGPVLYMCVLSPSIFRLILSWGIQYIYHNLWSRRL